MRTNRFPAVLGAASAAIAFLVVTPQSALADFGGLDATSWSYTDVRHARKSFVNEPVDAPAGAWIGADNSYHRSKSYFTYDLTALHGATVEAVTFRIGEKSANDCTKPRSTELWTTQEPVKPPTWSQQPAELVKLPGPFPAQGTECVWDYALVWDATQEVRKAVAAKQKTVTFAMRMPEQVEIKPSYGRRYANNPRLSYQVNWPPDTPTDGVVGFNDKCADGPSVQSNYETYLLASVRDRDYEWLTARFAIWPADDPAARREWTTDVPRGYPIAQSLVLRPNLQDGRMYKWTVRVEDASHVSDWMTECAFSTDYTPPDKAPEVSSSDYPENSGPPGHGGVGIPGRFTLDSAGVSDVVGFYFNGQFVAAGPGGAATIDYAPQYDGPVSVEVMSVDKGRHRSPSRHYRFWVATTGP